MTLLHQAAQKAVEVLTEARDRIACSVCYHDETQRRGFIWTECLQCGAMFADDKGGVPAPKEPKELAQIDAAIAQLSAALQHQEVPSDKQIARAFADEQMRQGSGTHNRHEWFRRGALWAASPSTTRQQEVGIFDKTGERINALAKEAGFHMEPMTNMLYTVRGNHAQLVNFARLVLAAAPSTPEKAGGVSDGAPAVAPVRLVEGPPRDFGQAQDRYGEHMDRPAPAAPSPIPHPLPAQANDGGEQA